MVSVAPELMVIAGRDQFRQLVGEFVRLTRICTVPKNRYRAADRERADGRKSGLPCA